MDTEMSGSAATHTTEVIDLDAIDEQLEAVVAPLEASHSSLVVRKRALMSEVTVLDDKIKKIERTLRTLKPECFERLRRAQAVTSQSGNVGPRSGPIETEPWVSLIRLAHWSLKRDDEFTPAVVAEDFDVPLETAVAAVETLRNEEFLRLVRPGVYTTMPDAEHVWTRLFEQPGRGLAQSPTPRDDMHSAAQRGAEERRDQVVRWMLDHRHEQVTSAKLAQELDLPFSRVGDDLRELMRRGVVRDLGEAPKPDGFIGRTGRLYDLA